MQSKPKDERALTSSKETLSARPAESLFASNRATLQGAAFHISEFLINDLNYRAVYDMSCLYLCQ